MCTYQQFAIRVILDSLNNRGLEKTMTMLDRMKIAYVGEVFSIKFSVQFEDCVDFTLFRGDWYEDN